MKPIFITVDTEGDALWSNSKAEDIQTENVLWIPRFQELCEKYGFVPELPQEWLSEGLQGNGEFLQLLPGVHACDGFFIARLRKR